MRSLLTLLGAAVVTFAVVGYFLGWYQIHTTPGPDGHRRVDIDINGKKIKQDVQNGEQRILNAVQRNASGTPGSTAVALPPAGPATPLPAPESLPQPPSLPPPSGTITIRPTQTGPPVPQAQGGTWTFPSD